MHPDTPALLPDRRTSWTVLAAAAVAVAALVGTVAHGSLADRAPARSAWPLAAASSNPPPISADLEPRGPQDRSPLDRGGDLGMAGGAVPGDASAFDASIPAVAHLDPALLAALRRAAADAAAEGVELRVNGGWRSAAYQEQLLREAVAEHGSLEEASRWVASPETSEHVAGRAVDVGPRGAASWLDDHGARYGLCRTYENEPWHFERRPDAVDHGCPATYDDPTQDPRMRP